MAEQLRFTEEHEWIRPEEGGSATVGITPYAQEQLGDVVYVELPAVGTKVEKGKQFAVVESVKAASEVYAPVTGEVVAVNEKLGAEPATVNGDALGEGWFVKIRLAKPEELEGLMDRPGYDDFVKGLS